MAVDTTTESGRTSTDESVRDENSDQEVRVEHDLKDLTRKLVDVSAENKSFRKKAATLSEQNEKLQKELETVRTAQMQEQGKYKEMYEAAQKKLQEVEESTKKREAQLAYDKVSNQLAASAAAEGCANVTDLIKLATADRLINELDVSQEDYSVTPESLKSVLEKARQKYPYLYGRPTPGVRDGIPSTTKQTKPATRDLSTKSMDELIALAKSI
jgi:hypothetical protein